MLLDNARIASPEQKVDVPQDCLQIGLKKLAPAFEAAGIIDDKPRLPTKHPVPVKLTGIAEDIAFCRRAAGAIDELLNEASTIATNIAIGAVYAKAHAWLARNSKTDAARIGWRRAFEEAYFPHKRRQAEDLICIHTVFAGTAVPANFPHNLRSQRLLARQVKNEKLSLEELQSVINTGVISALSTEVEIREVLGLKRSKIDDRQTGATATPDIIQNIPVREFLQLLSTARRQELINLVVGEHAGSAAAVKAAAEITAVLVKNRKVQDIIAAAGFIPSNFRVIFQVRLAAAA